MTMNRARINNHRGTVAPAIARALAGSSVLAAFLLLPPDAHASLLSPELEDKLATVIALFVLFLVPVVLIVLFWMVHILPEKIAHQAESSAVRGDSHAVPAVAGVRRTALADCLDLGVLEAGAVQDGVRHRSGRRRR